MHIESYYGDRNVSCNRLSVPIPSVSTSASSYGAFMGISGNMRYQLVNGAERVMQDHFQHLGVAIFFSAALRYVLELTADYCSIYSSNSLSYPPNQELGTFEFCLIARQAVTFEFLF